ncbi:MAG: RNA methyltransferase [Gammaproteobacteria bacterium]|nr:RNA methyltransferase [Gammaproteobacteria bacterium]
MPTQTAAGPGSGSDRATPSSFHVRIVLVEPSHPGNIGGAARAMKTMGFGDLALVRPKRFPDPQAEWRAAGATDVLRAARVFDSVDEAVADCALVAGTSARRRRIPLPVDSAADFAARVTSTGAAGSPLAVLFGREDSGLTNDELERCTRHVVIPAHPGYASLNLAMAVQVVCYELFKVQSVASEAHEQRWDRPLASAAELAGFHAHLEEVLVAIEFEDPKAPRRTMTRLKRLFGRVELDETEVAILRGVLTHVQRAMRKRR